MKLKCVTMTGLNDHVDQNNLIRISERYPFVEWGILISESKSGNHPRYPAISWLPTIAQYRFNYSLHLCGAKYAISVATGETELSDLGIPDCFGRVQFNISHFIHLLDFQKFGNIINNIRFSVNGIIPEVIIQIGKIPISSSQLFEVPDASFLFDQSGGRGELPEIWPEPFLTHKTGYAGGLTVNNLDYHLHWLNKVCGDAEIWIDAESGVMTDDRFDLDKVEQFLKIAEPFT